MSNKTLLISIIAIAGISLITLILVMMRPKQSLNNLSNTVKQQQTEQTDNKTNEIAKTASLLMFSQNAGLTINQESNVQIKVNTEEKIGNIHLVINFDPKLLQITKVVKNGPPENPAGPFTILMPGPSAQQTGVDNQKGIVDVIVLAGANEPSGQDILVASLYVKGITTGTDTLKFNLQKGNTSIARVGGGNILNAENIKNITLTIK